ncbi:MAG: hypothetical protein U1E17_04665 [Geminicoccaceae bacterium]
MDDLGQQAEPARTTSAGAGGPAVPRQAGGLDYRPGISAETARSQALHLQLVELPPGARAKAHKHAHHETAIHVLGARAACGTGRGSSAT